MNEKPVCSYCKKELNPRYKETIQIYNKKKKMYEYNYCCNACIHYDIGRIEE